jgi:hypothetical protein
MLPLRARYRTRGHQFHVAWPEVMGSGAGTHCLILEPADPIASGWRFAGGSW